MVKESRIDQAKTRNPTINFNLSSPLTSTEIAPMPPSVVNKNQREPLEINTQHKSADSLLASLQNELKASPNKSKRHSGQQPNKRDNEEAEPHDMDYFANSSSLITGISEFSAPMMHFGWSRSTVSGVYSPT